LTASKDLSQYYPCDFFYVDEELYVRRRSLVTFHLPDVTDDQASQPSTLQLHFRNSTESAWLSPLIQHTLIIEELDIHHMSP
jgi:hypothetical protein